MATIDINVDDFYDECTDTEKDELVYLLEEDGFYGKMMDEFEMGSPISLMEDTFRDNIKKIMFNYQSLTDNELAVVENISNRF